MDETGFLAMGQVDLGDISRDDDFGIKPHAG